MSRAPHRRRGAPYIFPRHRAEVHRLDLQHYALREALDAGHLAPVAGPRRVLDVGCGTGTWLSDLRGEFPEALVVGLDVDVGKLQRGPGLQFVAANVLRGLPFAGGGFDYVHQRLLGTGLPLRSWPAVVEELVRVARPGGWIELAEGRFALEPSGPATARLFELARRLARSLQLDAAGVSFRTLDGYLARAGAVEVRRREVELPVGEWGERVGSFMASDFRAAFSRLCEAFRARFAFSGAECDRLLAAAREEWEVHRSRWTVAYVVGQKPG